MPEVHLSDGEQVTVKCCCKPCAATLKSSEGIEPSVDLFEVTNGMPCPYIGLKRNHADDFPVIAMRAVYMGSTDDEFPCVILEHEFPDRHVKIYPDNSGNGAVSMPESVTIWDMKQDTIYVVLENVLAGFTAEQLKAAMSSTMRSELAAILP